MTDTHSPSDIVIVGGGVYGTSLAYMLAKKGKSVTLLEKGEIASGASGGPGERGVRANRRDLRELPVVALALDLWAGFEAELDGGVGYRRIGGIQVFDLPYGQHKHEVMGRLEAMAQVQSEMGVPSELLDRDALLAREPELNPRLLGAIYCKNDGTGDHGRATRQFAKAAEALGVQIRTGARVVKILHARGAATGVELEGGEVVPVGEQLVLLANPGTRALLGPIDPLVEKAPVWNMMPQMMYVDNPHGKTINHLLSHASRRLAVKQLTDGTIMISGGASVAYTPEGLWQGSLSSMALNVTDAIHTFPFIDDFELFQGRCLAGGVGDAGRRADHRPARGAGQCHLRLWLERPRLCHLAGLHQPVHRLAADRREAGTAGPVRARAVPGAAGAGCGGAGRTGADLTDSRRAGPPARRIQPPSGGTAMPFDFDPAQPGKHFHDLTGLVPPQPGIGGEVLCTLSNGPGPVVVLLGGIHGDEYEAQIVLRRLAEALRPEDVTGRILILPSLNFPAGQSGARISPFDGQNMNRVFPGRGDGTPTEALADFLVSRILPGADLLIDVHAGGSDCTVVPMVFGFTGPGCSIDDGGLTRIMEAWGYRYVQHVKGIRETACGIAPLHGTASIEIEGGGGGRLLPRELAIMEDGILRGLAAAGVLRALRPALPFQGVHLDMGPENRVLAPGPGLVEHLVGLGDIVASGQPVALLHPLAGEGAEPTELCAGRAGVMLRQCDRVWIGGGGLVCNTGTARPG